MEWLSVLRIANKMSQAEVASKCGISRQYYCYIENKRVQPSVTLAKKIAELLGFGKTWYRLLGK